MKLWKKKEQFYSNEQSSSLEFTTSSESFLEWCKTHPINLQWLLFSIFVIILAMFIFYLYYDFTRLSWKDGNETLYVKNTNVVLEVEAFGHNGVVIDDISFYVKEGKIKTNGNKVIWTLPARNGVYEIIATAPSGKQITKTVELSMSESELAGLIQLEQSLDSDFDGISDVDEKLYQTNEKRKDTDRDGLSDYIEVMITKTNPLNKDSDEDGLEDGVELDLNLNPNLKITNDDNILDNKRLLEYEKTKNGVAVKVKGYGNISKVQIDTYSYNLNSKLLPILYQIDLAGELLATTISFSYRDETLKQYHWKEEQLQIFKYELESGNLIEVPTIVKQNENLLMVQDQESGYYVVGIKNTTIQQKNVLFLIDQTTSMYSKKEFDKVGRICIGCNSTDVNLKRFDLTSLLASQMTNVNQYSVAIFSKGYIESLDWTKSKEQTTARLGYLKRRTPDWKEEVDLNSILGKAVSKFEKQNFEQYIVLVTDSKDTEENLQDNIKQIIKEANDKNIHFIIVALGDYVDSNLNVLANQTNGLYLESKTDDSLEDTFMELTSYLNKKMVSVNFSKSAEHMILADSGFYTTKNGFSFSNFSTSRSEDGNCYGMSLFASLYFQGKLPLTLEEIDYSLPTENGKYYASSYNLENTYFRTNQPLYDYKITDSRLKLYLEPPQDFYELRGDILYLKNSYYQQLKSIGMKANIKTQIHVGGVNQFQEILLNLDSTLFRKNVKKDEAELFYAIFRYYLMQLEDHRVLFATNPDSRYQNILSELNNGNPIILGIDSIHAVNATRVLKDVKDSNTYYIEVYDNNYSGEPQYIKVIRNYFSDFQRKQADWITAYDYTFYYEGKEVSLDLSYPS